MTRARRQEREAALERQSYLRHELRAPLAVMIPLVSLLLGDGAGPLTELQRDYLAMLERNLARMHVLVGAATESGWLDCAAAPQVPAAVPLRELVEDLVARFAARLDAVRVEVTTDGPAAVGWADPDNVRCILCDILDNAVRHAPGAPVRLAVRASADGATVMAEVSDAGPGMSAEDAGRAFEFGSRGEAARAAGVHGLGVGLWVCRTLAEANGGSIELRTAPGAGTTVTVTLPTPPG